MCYSEAGRRWKGYVNRTIADNETGDVKNRCKSHQPQNLGCSNGGLSGGLSVYALHCQSGFSSVCARMWVPDRWEWWGAGTSYRLDDLEFLSRSTLWFNAIANSTWTARFKTLENGNSGRIWVQADTRPIVKFSNINHPSTAMWLSRPGKLLSSLLACLRARYATNQVRCGQYCTNYFMSCKVSTTALLDLWCDWGPACFVWRTFGSVGFHFTVALEPPEQKFHVQRSQYICMTSQAWGILYKTGEFGWSAMWTSPNVIASIRADGAWW